MKKKILILAIALVSIVTAAMIFLTIQTAVADSSKITLNWQKELNKKKCDNLIGSPIINVTQKVSNDADSGIAGNYWAFDSYKRDIKVWKTNTPGVFCAIVKYHGEFKAVAGQKSPGNTGILTGKEHGSMEGGYRAVITGSLLENPTWRKKGSVGKFDYKCDINGNCPGRVNWSDQYFTAGYTFEQPWWGWIYRAGRNGTWVNAVSGNLGDILVLSHGK